MQPEDRALIRREREKQLGSAQAEDGDGVLTADPSSMSDRPTALPVSDTPEQAAASTSAASQPSTRAAAAAAPPSDLRAAARAPAPSHPQPSVAASSSLLRPLQEPEAESSPVSWTVPLPKPMSLPSVEPADQPAVVTSAATAAAAAPRRQKSSPAVAGAARTRAPTRRRKGAAWGKVHSEPATDVATHAVVAEKAGGGGGGSTQAAGTMRMFMTVCNAVSSVCIPCFGVLSPYMFQACAQLAAHTASHCSPYIVT